MKKINQTIVDSGKGNCQQAAIASLLELELEEVPNFNLDQENFWKIVWDFMGQQGYNDIGWEYPTDKTPGLIERLKFDGGWKGCFPATVPSQTFKDATHAVLVDSDLNVVHDPNPNKLALKCKPEDVMYVMVKGGWHIDLEGNFVRETTN